MMSDERPQEDLLQSIIANILDAETRGEPIDREGIVRQHPEYEQSLREFFVNNDALKGAGTSGDLTLPPSITPSDAATLPPGQAASGDATLPPNSSHETSRVEVADRVRYFGDYELLQEIARGGTSVVYKARQTNLNRIVALKMILSGQLASDEDVIRFYTEAEAVANLSHPGIVPIFDVGEHQGQHYFSMGYIEGPSLADKVADGPLPPREATDLVAKICEAMSYAHDRGVIHRDLKPANILIDQNGEPKVTDFGLAKRTESDSNLTGTGQILGTPSYMAPEQASGTPGQIGPLADVYALGAILYCLLTGRPPFQAANPMDTLLQVLDKEPVPLRQINSSIPLDLETVTTKCLEKDGRRRYQSVSQFESELERFATGRPVLARSVSRLERSRRWCERNPAVASLSTLALFLLVVGTGFSTYFASQARQEASKANHARELAKSNESVALENEAKSKAQAQRADKAAADAKLQRAEAEWQLYLNQISSAQRALKDQKVGAARRSLASCDEDLRDWEFGFLHARTNSLVRELQVPDNGSSITSLAFNPDNTLLIGAHVDGSILGWSLQEGQVFQISPPSPKQNHTNALCVAISPDGNSLLSGFGREYLRPSTTPFARIQRCNITSKELEWSYTEPAQIGFIACVAYSPDGQYFAYGGGDGATRKLGFISVRENNSGNEVWRLSGHQQPVACLKFSPDGKHLASGGYDQTVRLCDLASGKTEQELVGHTARISSLAFSPDGTLASGSWDRTIRIWNPNSGIATRTFVGHEGPVNGLAFDQSGERLFSSGGSTVRIWGLTSNLEKILLSDTSSINSIALTSDDKLIASAGRSKAIELRDEDSIRGTSYPFLGPVFATYGAAFSPNGESVATGGVSTALVIWNARTGEKLHELSGHQSPIQSVAFSPDGKLIASGGGNEFGIASFPRVGEIKIWDANTMKMVVSVEAHGGSVCCLDFSPDGRTLVSGGSDQRVRLWDVASWQEVDSLSGHTDTVTCIAFSPDGRLIASGSRDDTLKIWDADKATLLITGEGHSGDLVSLAFSRDGANVVTTSKANDGSGELITWQSETGIAHRITSTSYQGVVFSPSGRRVICSAGAELHVWDTSSSRRILTWPESDSSRTRSTGLAMSRDGKRITSGAVIWNVDGPNVD